MKRITSLVVLGLALMVSCTKEGPITVNEITDLYTVPAGATTITLSDAKSTWSTDRRYFDLSFGNDLTTTLVGYDALLAPGQYVIGADQIGNAINTKVKGQNAGEGFITVNEKNGQYQITAHINGQVYYWTGTLPFQADPAPTALTVVQQAQSNKQNGVNSLTLQLATEGISQGYDENWQPVWTGEGGYLALDLYSDDGYLHDGTYTACAEGGVINPGEFGIGYDTTFQWGDQVYPMYDWGTCWWTVKDGAATATKITDGLLSISSRDEIVEGEEVTIWTISWGKDYPKELVFEGAIPNLTKPKREPDFAHHYKVGELQSVTTQAGDVVEGVKKHPVTITDAKGATVAYFEILLAEGETDYEGEYPSTSYASAAGQLADGWEFDASAWGMGIMTGGSYFVNEAGETVLMKAGEWTLKVTKLITGAYEFEAVPADASVTGYKVQASGPDYVEGSYQPEGGDFDGVELTQFGGITNYYELYGGAVNLVGVELATAGITITAGGWGNSYSGDGNYLKLEFYTEDGSISPGTYTPCAVGGTLTPGTFGIGYDGSWGASGTTWYTLAGGNTTYEYVTDGTLTIAESGGEYEITLKSSTVNVHYKGPFSK